MTDAAKLNVTFPRTKIRGGGRPDWKDVELGGKYVGSYSQSSDTYASFMRWTGELQFDDCGEECDGPPCEHIRLVYAASEPKLRKVIREALATELGR